MKKLRFILSALFIFTLLFLTASAFSVSALPTNAAQAPGGSVTTVDEFITALGGSENADVSGNTIYLKRDITLNGSIYIKDGSYRLIGRGCSLYRGNASMEALIFLINTTISTVSPSLELGNENASSASEQEADLTLDGNKTAFDVAANGPLVALLGDVDLKINPSVHLINNHSAYPGGAVYMEASVYGSESTPLEPHLTVNGAGFYDNSSDIAGGAIYLSGNKQTDASGAILISNAVFSGNSSVANNLGKGGAICVEGGCLTLLSSTLTSNISDLGGAVYADFETVINSSVFTMNRANASGGAIYIGGNGYSPSEKDALNNSPATLISVYIEDNSSAGSGGAITNFGFLTVDATEVTYVNRNASTGDGACIYNAGKLILNGGQFFYNESSAGRGGIFNSGTVTLSGADLRFNSAKVGGAIFNEGEFFLCGGYITSNKNAEEHLPQILNKGSFDIGRTICIDGDVIGNLIHLNSNGETVFPAVFVSDNVDAVYPIRAAIYREVISDTEISYEIENKTNYSVYYGHSSLVKTAAESTEIFAPGFGSYKMNADGTMKFVFPVMPIWAWVLSLLGLCGLSFGAAVLIRKRKKHNSESTDTPTASSVDE